MQNVLHKLLISLFGLFKDDLLKTIYQDELLISLFGLFKDDLLKIIYQDREH